MLDIAFIRAEPEKVREGIAKKNKDPKTVDKFLRVDDEWRLKTVALDQLKAEQNVLNKELATHQSDDLLSKAQLLKKRVVDVSSEHIKLKEKREELLHSFPNLPFEDVPVGKDESENKVLREVGTKPEFSFEPKDYLALGEALEIINIKKAAEVSGSRFGYLVGDGALLELALVQYAFSVITKHGFTPIIPPVMIKPEVYKGMGRLDAGQEDERYFLPKDNLYLVGSSEHTIGPIHMEETFSEEALPKRYVGFSTCFRREAGSYGKDTKGILRVHQFDKVEMFIFSRPEKSDEEHKLLLKIQEEIVAGLGLPYRVVQICTGDMGWTDAKQFDIETWMPGEENPAGQGRGTYRETHSCSNTTDFQSRGMNTKYKSSASLKDKKAKAEYVHFLNATGIAIGRIIIAIIENNQTKEGTIKIPEALHGFMGKKEIKPRE